MKNYRFLSLLASLLLLALAPGSSLGQDEEIVTRVYKIRNLQQRNAVMLAHQACLAENDTSLCTYDTEGPDWFSYATNQRTQEKIATILAEHDVPPANLNLRIALLVADEQQRPMPELSKGEKDALGDLMQFLPYKGFRILETGWIRSHERADLLLGSDPSYEVNIVFHGQEFPAERSIIVERFFLFRNGMATEEGHQDGAKIINTSFAMDVGETVVVGTSKLNGNGEALVVLLTSEE